VKTFEEIFCEKHQCSPREFSDKLFWKCLHRRAIPVAPVILLFNSGYFFPDRSLIAQVRRAERMNQVWEELREYFIHPNHQGFLRRKLNIRLSGRRLIETAKEYLPSSGSPPPPYSSAADREGRGTGVPPVWS